MNKIKSIILLVLCFSIIFLMILFKKNNERLVESSDKLQSEKSSVLIKIKLALNDKCNKESLLLDIDEIKQMIQDEELLKTIEQYNFNGCFKIGEGKIEYEDNYCRNHVIDTSISNNPVLVSNMIPVKYVNGKYFMSNYIDWYDYNKLQFAYAVIADGTYSYQEEIPNSKIKNIFLWVPSFYYNEKANIIEYFNHEANKDMLLPRGFFYRNSHLYGIWVQMDKRSVSDISNGSNVDLHQINEDDKIILKLFEHKYHIKNLFTDVEKIYIVSVGKGNFTNE